MKHAIWTLFLAIAVAMPHASGTEDDNPCSLTNKVAIRGIQGSPCNPSQNKCCQEELTCCRPVLGVGNNYDG